MTSFTLPLHSSTAVSAQEEIVMPTVPTNLFQRYQLKWRQEMLYVSLHSSSPDLAPVSVAQLKARLRHSFVRCVCLDPSVGEEHVNAWAKACQQTGKAIYLRSVKGSSYSSPASPISQEFVNAILTPILLVTATVINRHSPTPVLYKQWCVGDRGKVFQAWQFRPVGTLLQNV